MFSQKTHRTLTRRGSKLLVEAVIGIIGILGILLAQVGEKGTHPGLLKPVISSDITSVNVTDVPAKKDWLEVLF